MNIHPLRHMLTDWYDKWTTSMTYMTRILRININFTPDMTRLCALYELSNLRSLSLQHYLDPMHIFKNVCKSLISHLVEEKNNVAARKDLEFLNTKQQL